MSQPQKCTFWEKGPKRKKMAMLHFMTTLHIFALKIEICQGTRMVEPILKTRNATDKC